ELLDGKKAELYQSVRQWHASHPTDAGIQVDVLLRMLDGALPRPLYRTILAILVRERSLALVGGLVKCREYRPSSSPQLQKAWLQLSDYLAQAGFRIPL